MAKLEDIEIRFSIDDRKYRWQGGYIKAYDRADIRVHDTKIDDKRLLQIKQEIETRVQELIKEAKI